MDSLIWFTFPFVILAVSTGGTTGNQTQSHTYDVHNYDLQKIVTPVDVRLLDKLLTVSGYHKSEAAYLIKGFTEGWSIRDPGIDKTPPEICHSEMELVMRVRYGPK